MNTDIRQAVSVLTAEGCTCVLCKADQIYKSHQRGVMPLLACLDSGNDYRGYAAADKVVGKATAFLYCLLGVRAVHAPVMSRAALQVLTCHGIAAGYDVLTDAIQNHRRDGFCPMETATRDVSTPEEALPVIRRTLAQLRANRP